jgi:hypothetical protein
VKENERGEISGNTFRVYWYVLKKGEHCGVREVQRALGFSSSNSAHYHLERLTDKGFLIKNEYGSYQVNSRIRTGTISHFVFIHGLSFPQQLRARPYIKLLIRCRPCNSEISSSCQPNAFSSSGEENDCYMNKNILWIDDKSLFETLRFLELDAVILFPQAMPGI